MVNTLIRYYSWDQQCFIFNGISFYFSLVDVRILTGLPIEGLPVIGTVGGYHRLFSDAFELEANDEGNPITGGKIRLSWLRDRFSDLDIDHDHPRWPAYIRAYFLYVIGSYIIPDTSTGLVSCQYLSLLGNINHIGRYAWGAAAWANMHSCLQRGVINGLSYALMVSTINYFDIFIVTCLIFIYFCSLRSLSCRYLP